MSSDDRAALRLQRDQLAHDLDALRAAIDSLRAQHAVESEMGEAAGASLASAEAAFDEARKGNEGRAARYQQLVAEERALRERIEELRGRHGR